MQSSDTPTVQIDLARIRHNCQQIAAQTRVPILAVVKADAYGLGASQVSRAIADLVDGFYVFDAAEALAANLKDLNKYTIALRGESNDPADFCNHAIRPVVWTADQAAMLKRADPVLSVDTGQQRFGCDLRDIGAILKAGEIREAMTHATFPLQAQDFFNAMEQQTGGAARYRKHAAGSALLSDPSTWFDAVRPGLALYTDAFRVTAPLIHVKDSNRPAGYSMFNVPRFGVILLGYSAGLRPGPCLVNGRPQNLLEVGMQTAFVQITPHDKIGDTVTLLGDGLTAQTLAQTWRTTPQEVLVQLSRAGPRVYLK